VACAKVIAGLDGWCEYVTAAVVGRVQPPQVEVGDYRVADLIVGSNTYLANEAEPQFVTNLG
jgi:hypothetical protein